MTLSELSRGDTAIITQIRSPDPEMREKLHSRGMLPGTELSVMQTGNPLVVGIERSRWALNRNEAAHIEVSRLEAGMMKRPFRARIFRKH